MMHSLRFLSWALSLVVAVVLCTGSAWAAIETYTLNRPHTQVMFKVSHMGISYSHGKFLDYSGTIQFDREKPENSSVQATIKTNSLEMGDGPWNEHLKSKDFFDVATFPDMTFKSQSIKVLSDKTADILGDLTLHGVIRPVTLHTTFNAAQPIEFSKDYRAGFTATAKIKRSDFGMMTYLPLIGDDVEITIEVESVRQDQPAPAAAPSVTPKK